MSQVELNYEPREQFMDLHHRTQRWACLVVHRRGGKTVACINELITRATYTPKQDARYAYIAPFYRQAKDVAWQYLKSFGEGVIVKIRESELRVELFNGAWITLYGADNPDALRGLYLDGVVLDEYGDCRPSLWGTVILPTLVDRKGWAIFIGTPKGKNHFWEVMRRSESEEGWYHLTLKASESGLIDAEELAEMQAQMTDEEYQQEMECDFEAAVKGTYYAAIIQQMEGSGKISDGSPLWDPSKTVKVASDLGRSDSTAWWFWQDTPTGPAIIDYYEATDNIVDDIIAMLNTKPYEYEEVWLPHDAVAHTFQTRRSTLEQMIDADFPCMVVPKLSKQHGIDAARKVLPLCTINRVACYDGVEALRAYKRKFNELTKAFAETPEHTWASNGADAFRYMSLVCMEKSAVKSAIQKAEPVIKPPEYSLDQLWKDREGTGHRYEKLRM